MELSLDDHNKHLAILGLPPVRAPLVAGPTTMPLPPAKPGSPLAMLDKFYAGEGPTAPRGRFIQMTVELRKSISKSDLAGARLDRIA